MQELVDPLICGWFLYAFLENVYFKLHHYHPAILKAFALIRFALMLWFQTIFYCHLMSHLLAKMNSIIWFAILCLTHIYREIPNSCELNEMIKVKDYLIFWLHVLLSIWVLSFIWYTIRRPSLKYHSEACFQRQTSFSESVKNCAQVLYYYGLFEVLEIPWSYKILGVFIP